MSASERFGRGGSLSIRETVSETGRRTGGSFSSEVTFTAAAGCTRAFAFATMAAGLGFSAGATFELFVVFSFGSAGSARTAAFTGLRAGAALRTAVLVVVFEGILFF